MTRRDFIRVSSAGAVAATEAMPLPAEGAAHESLPTLQGAPAPDLGSHWAFLEKLAADVRPRLSFLEDRFTDPQAWTEQARATLQDGLSYAPEPCDPQPETVERVDRGAYVRERVLINTAPHCRIPVYVLVPKELDKPAPGIVALHDHGGFYFWGKEKVVEVAPEHPELTRFKQGCYASRSIADELAKRGFVVVAPDMLHWGERALYLDADPERIRNRTLDVTEADIKEFNARSWAHEELLGRTVLACGATWSGIIASDDSRVADYLAARPDVDPRRLGCIGLSVGAVRSMFLGALHPLVRASVAVCWMSEYPAMARNHIRNGIGFTKLVPGLYGDLDWPDLAGLHWPGSLMTISGLQDALFPVDAMRRAVDKARRIFEKAGSPDNYRGVFFDGPHEFNLELQEQAFAWLEEKLA
jgi:dienelactone hydrolase